MFLSIVVPIRNEEKNIPELHERLTTVCESFDKPYEILYVENASTDNSVKALKSLNHAKVIVMRWMPYMRKAQSLAMDAGFKAAKGKYIVYIDGDLQVEPEEIPAFIQKLDEGYDVVCAWRQKRIETKKLDIFKPLKFVLRTVFTYFRKKLINEGIHDPGGALKAFRSEALKDTNLYGEMHRFLVAMLHWQGYKITEIKVKHHPRKHGESNYSISKGFQGFADLLNVFIWRKYADRPLHLFGVSGLFIFSMGCLSLLILLGLRAFEILALKDSIFPILSVLVIVIGLQLFLSGVISDSISRMHYSDGNKIRPYDVKEVVEV